MTEKQTPTIEIPESTARPPTLLLADRPTGEEILNAFRVFWRLTLYVLPQDARERLLFVRAKLRDALIVSMEDEVTE